MILIENFLSVKVIKLVLGVIIFLSFKIIFKDMDVGIMDGLGGFLFFIFIDMFGYIGVDLRNLIS